MEQPWNTVRDAIPDVLEHQVDPGDPKFETAKLVRNWNLWLITVAAAICALLWQPLQTANHFPRPTEYWFLLLAWMSFCFAILIAMLLVATLPAIMERVAAAHYERIRMSHRSLYGRLAFLHRVPLQHAFFVLGVVSTMLFVVARPPAGQANMVRAAFTPIRVHCGGEAFTDPVLHQVWTADRNFAGGSTFKTPNAVTVSANPGQRALYQSQRYGSFRYDFPVPYGTYVLNLKFAEIWYTEPEKRTFDVIINGETMLHNFDIVAQAGGPNIAVDRSFIVGPTTLITIEWKPRVDNAEVNAIEILEQPASVREPAPPQARLARSDSTAPPLVRGKAECISFLRRSYRKLRVSLKFDTYQIRSPLDSYSLEKSGARLACAEGPLTHDNDRSGSWRGRRVSCLRRCRRCRGP